MILDPAYADHFRRCLEECDVATARKIWAHVAPGMPQPATDFEALITLHHARTQCVAIRMRLRAWSHRWLLDHGLPSGLPDRLKPRAERIYPQVVSAVGISVNATSSRRLALAEAMQGAMEYAVLEAYADHQTEPAFVKTRMIAARDRVLKS
jgi:hypothetical protein